LIARRPLVAALAAAASLLLGAEKKDEAAAPEAADPSSWYAQRITQGDSGVTVEHHWSKGRKLRAELVVQGRPVLTLVNGEFYTIVDPMSLTGVKIRRSPEALAADRSRPNERPFGREGEDAQRNGAEIVRSDKLAGQPVRVLRQTDERGKREVWVTDDKRKLPLRVDFFARDSGAQTVTNYIDWLSALPLPDSFFEPDPRATLETVEYADYVARSASTPVGPAPVLFSNLLHGK